MTEKFISSEGSQEINKEYLKDIKIATNFLGKKEGQNLSSNIFNTGIFNNLLKKGAEINLASLEKRLKSNIG